jgi:hypothetical protein
MKPISGPILRGLCFCFACLPTQRSEESRDVLIATNPVGRGFRSVPLLENSRLSASLSVVAF